MCGVAAAIPYQNRKEATMIQPGQKSHGADLAQKLAKALGVVVTELLE
jgi:hypothetical protein